MCQLSTSKVLYHCSALRAKKKEFSKRNTTNLEYTEILPQVKYFFVAKEKVLLARKSQKHFFLDFNYSKKPTKKPTFALASIMGQTKKLNTHSYTK